MATIQFQRATVPYICIPTWFVTDYVPQATSGSVKAYLYLFMLYEQGISNTLEEVAIQLEMLYSELVGALKYWDVEKVLSFKELESGDCELTFFMDKPAVTEKTVAEPAPLPLAKTFIQQTRPNYSLEELNIYKSQDTSISRLFFIAEQYLGRLLSPSDLQVLFGFYDWLHMPIDLIEYLLEYCTEKGHTNMRYIEKTAFAWVDQQITSVALAKTKIGNDKRYYKILSELGISCQTITSVQREFLSKWLEQYKLPMDIILEGCKRTVTHGNPPTLKYLDKILTSWHKHKVATLEDVALLDKAHADKQSARATTNNNHTATAKKNERFTNIYSHNWDFDELEKLEQAYIERKLNGGN